MKTSLTLAVFALMISVSAEAIPAFARKYQMSCTTCHSPAMPRIKGFGEEFAGNGFRMKDVEAPRYFIETGDQKLSLLKELPIAIRLEGHITYDNENSDAFEFGLPVGLKLLSGGEISKKLSYYFYVYLAEEGKVTGGRYLSDSERIDMLWTPLTPAPGGQEGNERGNPHVDVKEVLAIWRESVPEDMRKKWVNIDAHEEAGETAAPQETVGEAASPPAAAP